MLYKEEQKIRSSKQELHKIFTKYELSLKTNQEIISMLNESNYKNLVKGKNLNRNDDGNNGEEVIMFQPRNKRANNLTRQKQKEKNNALARQKQQQELNAAAALASQQQQNASASSTSTRNAARRAALAESDSEEENESEDEESEKPVSSSSNKNKPINKPAFNANFNAIKDKYFLGNNGKKYRITGETRASKGKRARTALKIDGEIYTKTNYESL